MDSQRAHRGHDFLPPGEALRKIPGAYGTEHMPAEDKTIWLHYFSAASDHYLAEVWHEPGQDGEHGQWMGFGYAKLAAYPEGAEWGYISLDELEQLRAHTPDGVPVIIERDLSWEPVKFSEIREAQTEPEQYESPEPPDTARAVAPEVANIIGDYAQTMNRPASRPDGLLQVPPEEAVSFAVRGRGRPPAYASEQMECPECGEDAVPIPATDAVPWDTHGIKQPQWSHKDGSSLCPVMDDSGYLPAQPRPKSAERQSGSLVSWQRQAQAEPDPGPTERQLEDWNIHNDHADGLIADHDMDREA